LGQVYASDEIDHNELINKNFWGYVKILMLIFFQYVTHQPTEKYLDMLYANNFITLITNPTRITDHSKTLIVHIYTNMPLSSLCTACITLYYSL
jgi:hypothetical protein